LVGVRAGRVRIVQAEDGPDISREAPHEKLYYQVATLEDLERLLSARGPAGRPPGPGSTPGLYLSSPEMINLEARQFLARVRTEFGDFQFVRPLISVGEEHEK
jgi:hypothetical protein